MWFQVSKYEGFLLFLVLYFAIECLLFESKVIALLVIHSTLFLEMLLYIKALTMYLMYVKEKCNDELNPVFFACKVYPHPHLLLRKISQFLLTSSHFVLKENLPIIANNLCTTL